MGPVETTVGENFPGRATAGTAISARGGVVVEAGSLASERHAGIAGAAAQALAGEVGVSIQDSVIFNGPGSVASESPDVVEIFGSVELPVTIDSVARRLGRAPELYSALMKDAAGQIGTALTSLEAQKPNDPETLDGYGYVVRVLEGLKSNFEDVATDLDLVAAITSDADKRSAARRVAEALLQIGNELIGFLEDNPKTIAIVIAQMGLAGTITCALGYATGVPPTITFPVIIAGLNGVNMWEAIKLFAPKKNASK
jgi:hypothetical protein